MKKIFCIILSLFCLSVSLHAGVRLIISDGISDAVKKQKIENNISGLLSEINSAQEAQRALNLQSLDIDDDTTFSLSMLWENSPFMVADDEIVERVITTGDGYQVRNIPLMMRPEGNADFNEDEYQEAVVNFDKNGNITAFYLSLGINLYMNVIRDNLELTDLRRRQMILDYVERFRTAYNQKDINFLNQVFSEDALIITGKVIKAKKLDGIVYPEHIEYNKRSKTQYISQLKRVFGANKRINVTFDDIKVMRHPANKDFYGVTLHQGYTSDNYHDDGYLFLLWDFQNEEMPQIHVRTWQPDEVNGKKLPESEIFNLSDFDI